MSIDYRQLRQWAKPMLAVAVVLLVLVLIPGIGREVSGARRWFRFKFISFQPSEFANLALIVYVADFVCRKGNTIRSFVKGFMPPVLILGGVSLLFLVQPDLGSTVALGVVIFLMLFIAGIRWQYLAYTILSALPLLYILICSVPYRRMRILSFLTWADRKGAGSRLSSRNLHWGQEGFLA